jgi:hypothetical protein
MCHPMEDTDQSKLSILYSKLLSANFEYLEELEKIVKPQYEKKIENMVLDEKNPFYKYYFSGNKRENSADIKKMIRELVLKVHPDKNNHEMAQNAFVKLEEYKNNNDIDTIKYLHSYIDSDDLVQIILSYVAEKKEYTIEEKVLKMKNSWWFLYHTDLTFRSLFVPNKSEEDFIF